jgi:hypothetical protein
MTITEPEIPKPSAEKEGILQRLLSIFSVIGGPDADRKKLLRSIGRELSRSRYKFYKAKGGEALPGLAKFFFEVYKIAAPAQVLLGNAAASGALRSFVIESFLDPEQRELSERLTDTHISERAKTLPLRDLQEEIKRDMGAFFAIFDAETSRQMDAAYATLISFVKFVNFDYYFLLKKFDSTLPEKSFSYHPRFEAINAEYVVEDIQDFLEVFEPLDLEAEWVKIFSALKEYRKLDVVQPETWAKFVPAIAELRRSGVLQQIVRHVKKDPFWEIDARKPVDRIVESFLQKLKTQIETVVQRLIQEKRSAKIEESARQVFGTSVVLRMRNYTEKANAAFQKKMLGGYVHAQAMNYLKAYLIDHFKKDVRELVDLLIIRGQWTTNILSQQLSDCYHAIMETSEAIIQFDDSLSEEGETATRMRSALARVDRDKDAMKLVRTMLKDINDRAAAMISKAAINLIGVGKHLKNLIEDYQKTRHELIINWKEIEAQSARPLKQWLIEDYKKLYHIVQLLQYFVKGETE